MIGVHLLMVSRQKETLTMTRDKTRKFIRQGDVMAYPITDLPEGLKPAQAENGRMILAHGEVTGHHHSFAMTDRVAMFREDGSGGGLFMFANGPVALEHQEHSTLTIKPGAWEVRRQRTLSASGQIQRVAD